MKPRRGVFDRPQLTNLLTASIYVGIIALVAFGYRSTREWQRSTTLLIERQTEQGADLLVNALGRDMRGVQASVLADQDWGEFSDDSPHDATDLAAAAFARYPYPESFFSWTRDDVRGMTFFNRANRFPPWIASHAPGKYPVVVALNPPGADTLRSEIEAVAAARRRYAVFHTELANQPYQVVARLTYNDPLMEHLETVSGFTVNLDWVRQSYFSDIVSQVARLEDTSERVTLAVLDERGGLVSGQASGEPAIVRRFPLLFLDPAVLIEGSAGLAVPIWTVRVGAPRQSPLALATRGVHWAVLGAGAALIGLAASLLLIVKTVRASEALAEMRADFVSSVTHELKTPLASIRALADTLVHRPDLGSATVRDYADLVTQETKRLARLVDNLLAYARITDVTEVYLFEPVVISELADDMVRDFRHRLTEGGFDLSVDVPPDLPLIRGDRISLRLALDNLLDNAIRYSGTHRSIAVTARASDSRVSIDIADRGMGIPSDELLTVQRKFVRGRLARANGTGLGLAIVSRIIADHGGTFVLESTLGSGTVARVGLPVLAE